MTPRLVFTFGGVLMAIAVALGAFGAHGLKARLTPDQLNLWQTGVTYHAWHGLGLIAIGATMLHFPELRELRYASVLLIIGIVLFSGSLYGLALGAPRGVGAITPFGGVAFIAGWIAFAFGTMRIGG